MKSFIGFTLFLLYNHVWASIIQWQKKFNNFLRYQIDDKPKDVVKQIHPIKETVQSTAIDELPEWLGGPKVSKDQKSQETENIVKREPAFTVNKISGNLGKYSPGIHPRIAKIPCQWVYYKFLL